MTRADHLKPQFAYISLRHSVKIASLKAGRALLRLPSSARIVRAYVMSFTRQVLYANGRRFRV